MLDKLVSIITPCYNGEKYLARMLDSILQQTYRNLELIVVNDGSTDQTGMIVSGYNPRFEQAGIKLNYIYQINAGLGASVDRGLKEFQGEYLTWMDYDDFLSKDSIAKKVAFLESHPEYGLVRTDGLSFAEESMDKPVGYLSGKNALRFNENIFKNILMGEVHCSAGCYLLRTSAFLDVNPGREIYPSRYGQNWQMLLPVTYKYKCGYIDEPLFYYVIRKESHSHCDDNSDLSRKLQKLDGYQDILVHTICSMDIDRKKYLALVELKYAASKFWVAREHRNVPLMLEQYQILKKHRSLSMNERICCLMTRYALLYRVYKFLKAAAAIPVSIAKQFALNLHRKSCKGKSKKFQDTPCLLNHPEKSFCCGCGACSVICSRGCITMGTDSEGFWYPAVDRAACIQCGLCEKVCPVLRKKQPASQQMQAYAAYCRDTEIRAESSSGGMFTLLAKSVIDRGGVVFGACFDSGFRVVHSYAQSREELSKFRGSKYVQSSIGGAYSQAKAFLENGRDVLFSGTPCQIAGLRSFLGKEYDGLLCVDIICHGVPSPKVWEKYKAFRESQANSKILSVSFRDKSEGWLKFSLSICFRNGTAVRQTLDKDSLMQAFLQNICLRSCCYSCQFKGENGVSDITLGDFWGIETAEPAMFDDKGTSLVITHNQKGDIYVQSVAEKAVMKKTDFSKAVAGNSAFLKPVKYNPARSGFFRNLDKTEFSKLADRYTKGSVWVKIKRKIRLCGGRAKRLLLNRR